MRQKLNNKAQCVFLGLILFGLVFCAQASVNFKQLEGEKKDYQNIVLSFQLKDSKLLQQQVDSFIRVYPKSVQADNALFLRGQLAFQKQNWSLALKDLTKIIDWGGNKTPAALLLKAQIYKELKVKSVVVSLLRLLEEKYPHSSEAQSARLELKLIATQ